MTPLPTKKCGRCKKDFQPKGKASWCNPCHAERQRERRKDPAVMAQKKVYDRQYRKDHPETVAKWYRKSNYGLTQEQYDALLEKQGGRCAIVGCESEGPLHVDHCHDSGTVRGLLCGGCNKALGFIRNNPIIATGLALYLESVSLTSLRKPSTVCATTYLEGVER